MADNAPGDIIYQDNPRSSTAQVVGDDDKLHGVQLVADTGGEVVYQDDPRSNNAMAYGSDGKLHRVQLVYNMSSGGGSGGGEVTSVNGKKGRVVLDAKDVNAIPQYSTMPEATSTNAGEIAQYSGETIPDVPATAVATQTVGSGLSNLSVDVDKFIEAEQPTQGVNTSFVASVVAGSVVFTVVAGNFTVSIPYSGLRQLFIDRNFDWDNTPMLWNGVFTFYNNGTQCGFGPNAGSDWVFIEDIASLSPSYGLVITGSPDTGIEYNYANYVADAGSTNWSKNGTTVDLANYGITYSGTPANGDTISVAYTPFVAGITNGYFYKSSVEYSDPVATISQTTGSGLSDLAVNVETFIETEQPTQDENVDFVASVVAENISPTTATVQSNAKITIDPVVFLQAEHTYNPSNNYSSFYISYYDSTQVEIRVVYGSGTTASDIVAISGLSDWGIVIDGDLQSGDGMSTNYSPAVVSWEKDGESVDISDYGISYSGTPADGDTLTVAYTAPVVAGYMWKQTDVQPSSGGASAGIEWQEPIVMTKPAGDNDYLAPYVHLGSESGSYSFYVKVLRLVGGYGGQVGNSALGYLVYKISFDYDSTNADFTTAISRGGIGLVFDGEMQSQFPNDNPIKYSAGVRLKKVQDGTLWVSVLTALQSDAFLYMNDGATEKVAQFSKVYKDGEIINAECFVDNGYFWENISYLNETSFTRSALVDIPQYNYRVYESFGAVDINNNTQMIIGGAYGATEVYVSAESGEDRFVGKLYRKDDANWEQEILIASGNFASWEFRQNNSNAVIYFGENASTFTDYVYFNVGAFGTGNITMIQLYFDTSSTTSVPMVRDGKSYRLLTPVYSMLGGVHQYVGPTNANYTNGYYYKANGTVVVVPESVTTNVTSPAGEATVTIDLNNFINELSNLFGWTPSVVRNYLVQYKDNDWGLGYDVGNDKVTRLYLPWYSEIYQTEVLQYVSVTYTGSETGEVAVGFRVTYTPETKEVQNPSWDRVDVQPAPEAIKVNTTATLAVADWSSSTQTVTVSGVKADSVVFVSPAPASASDYASAGILCTAQAADSLTFTCTTTPANAITVNIVCL